MLVPLGMKNLKTSLGPFFTDLEIKHITLDPSCVPKAAMLARSTGADVAPDDFKRIINSQSLIPGLMLCSRGLTSTES